MKKLRKFVPKNIFLTAFFLLVCICFLFHAKKTSEFAYIGLNTWFEQMIISLFPFMVFMNLLLRTGLSATFIRPFYVLLRPLFRNTPDAVFVIFFGFLCGFPLGCKSVCSFYKQGRISKNNAEYLLCFANNIGPAYMTGFFLSVIHPPHSALAAAFFLYGIPLLYGLFLRYTLYRKSLDDEYASCIRQNQTPATHSLLSALPDAVNDALSQIAMLGGYMIVFNALRIVPHLLLSDNRICYILSQSLLEISGGLLCVDSLLPEGILQTLAVYAVFAFNGLCCHFQSFSLMVPLQLSGKKYMLHKTILCSITVIFVWLYEMLK